MDLTPHGSATTPGHLTELTPSHSGLRRSDGLRTWQHPHLAADFAWQRHIRPTGQRDEALRIRSCGRPDRARGSAAGRHHTATSPRASQRRPRRHVRPRTAPPVRPPALCQLRPRGTRVITAADNRLQPGNDQLPWCTCPLHRWARKLAHSRAGALDEQGQSPGARHGFLIAAVARSTHRLVRTGPPRASLGPSPTRSPHTTPGPRAASAPGAANPPWTTGTCAATSPPGATTTRDGPGATGTSCAARSQ